MLRLIALLLPALIPSWRFFKTVAPSPRVEFRLIRDGRAERWCEDRPRPGFVTFKQVLFRVFWNPAWNEKLYMVSLSERVVAQNCAHAVASINQLVAKQLPDLPRDVLLQFRLVFVTLETKNLTHAVAYESDPVSIGAVER